LGLFFGTIGGLALGYRLAQTGPEGSGHLVVEGLTTVEGIIFGYLVVPYFLGGFRRLDRGLKGTPLPDLVAGVAGTIVGLVTAVLIGYFVNQFPYGVPLSAVLALLLAVVGASLGVTRRGELVAVFGGPKVDSDLANRRIKAALVDTSVIIDGRILDLVRTGFIDFKLIVPRCVLRELQLVADSSDSLRRSRGRRGLDVLAEIQQERDVRIEFPESDENVVEVDSELVRLARKSGYAVLTNDFNLNRVARLEGVLVLNINDIANAMKVIAVPGEELTVSVVREGKEPGQGVAYLDDGTMVVVESGRKFLNQTTAVTVTSVLQTAAGRLIFAQPPGGTDARRRRPE
jgi:uncharacterized protein YacL